ncbi:TPA: S8 family serine peptidase [Enterococcus faecium]|nr:S8 family serine peptidase [Enterococcus faecium]HAQ2175059.1 S8 family serine peptidase [Enterococcus faecium]HAQ2198161.1 S8 family serine peptidase [Enterococcus faecium]HAQ5023760.1 S8 family serine peptidase [Enterococcus faecium]HAZ1287567.1 S8 family serine peptidase [Enterococcus faecium]
MPSAWEETKGSKDVKVAVIDSGIDYQHEDLSGNVDESLGYDFFTFFKKIIIQNILTIFMQH